MSIWYWRYVRSALNAGKRWCVRVGRLVVASAAIMRTSARENEGRRGSRSATDERRLCCSRGSRRFSDVGINHLSEEWRNNMTLCVLCWALGGQKHRPAVIEHRSGGALAIIGAALPGKPKHLRPRMCYDLRHPYCA